ncbi:MAG: Family 2 glycosyl transferase [Phenylobacterium sp.]|nr:Family 2 glycosyl transferase [Phenylobacterium sp.]
MPLEPHDRHRGVVPPAPPGAARPLWSVMIPTFNCADLLGQTLSSVLASGYAADEMQIEVVDDCSTADDPSRVVQALGMGRVGFFRQPENLGHARNFNSCLARARGRLVHVLHGDDWVSPDFYGKIAALFAAKPALGAAFCRHVIANDDGSQQRISPLERQTAGVLENWLPTIAGELRLQPPSIVVQREVYEALGGFDTRMSSCGEDWEMWVRIAAHYPVGYLPESLAFYRDRSNSLTKRSVHSGQNIRDVRMATRIARSYVPAADRRALGRAQGSWAQWALHWSQRLIDRGDYAGAAMQLQQAFLCSRSPQTLRAIVRLGSYGVRHAWRNGRATSGWARRGDA